MVIEIIQQSSILYIVLSQMIFQEMLGFISLIKYLRHLVSLNKQMGLQNKGGLIWQHKKKCLISQGDK
jgi:hypothetical protein